MKYLSLLGSTGSIGVQTLELARKFPDELKVVALAAKSSVDLLEQQAREFRPGLVCIYNETLYEELSERLSDLPGTKVVAGMDGLLACASASEATMTVVALVGMIGIRPTMAAIEAGKDVALANKETLVTAGHLILPMLREHGVALYPIDSEHSAIFQSLQTVPDKDRDAFFEGHRSIKRILLTASGGPFRGKKLEEMKDFTAEDALKHPNWAMGKKITIDSATMVNKGLEMMEARWLFGLAPSQIQVVIHPQSVLHSAVEFVDGAVIGQMGTPDMRLPIEYAIMYPERHEQIATQLDLFNIGTLTFLPPDYENFPALALARDVLEKDCSYGQMCGSTLTVVYNAANEYAVAEFLAGRIGFTQIAEMIAAALENHTVIVAPTLEQVLAAESETVEFLKTCGTERERTE
ncbi:MAG: 1-deoxy-D-xylulose-5-phosphate reductoisomerase [Lachnospiraceae bacterium]|nr:1-deoxy-D-xylulose-5-phosphate reductoisomerase [Lachnospiraceae bacterium]